MNKCKICGVNTEVYFNINLKAVSICESCAKSIFIQQAEWYNMPCEEISYVSYDESKNKPGDNDIKGK